MEGPDLFEYWVETYVLVVRHLFALYYCYLWSVTGILSKAVSALISVRLRYSLDSHKTGRLKDSPLAPAVQLRACKPSLDPCS